ncbi:MAG: tetratricopeptide repeat protein, partial [Aggregatilineales bacterium]
GREPELKTLTGALKHSLKKQGSAWLVGGESGAGKTRLVDELRIEAMVNGVTVLRGEGVTGGGLSFQLWRDLMRQMVLMNALTDLEASVLKDLVPDIAKFIGRPVKDPPPLESIAAKQRLIQVVTELFQRQTDPILLILEDLHWLNESLDLIPALCDLAKTGALMIVGTYRSEERPQLSQDFPEMTPMFLNQLSNDEIAVLSSAMLGEAGQQTEILELLQRETGGNVFFLVETVRALAEYAGDLDNIGLVTLPATVFSGGIADIIRDRLHQLSEDDYKLLEFTALIGRVIEPELLYRIVNISQQHLGGWLIRMGNASVLTVEGETWRFAHDKLRQAVLADMTPDDRQQAHRQIAEALEQHYDNDETYVDILLQHWQAAGDTAKERHYTHIAGKRARDMSAFDDAKRHFLRMLTLLPDTGEENTAMFTHIYLGDVYELTGDYPLAIIHFWNGVDIALKVQNDRAISHALRGLGKSYWRQGDYDNGKIYLEEAVKYQPDGLTYVALGDLAWSQGRLEDARVAYGECLRLTDVSGNKNATSQALQGLGVLASRQERYDEARNYIEHSIAIKDEIGYRGGIAGGLNSLGIIAHRQKDYLASRNYFERSIRLSAEIGNVWTEINASCNLAFTCLATDRHDDALTALNRSLRLAIAKNSLPIILELLVGYAHVMYLRGQPRDAIILLVQVAEHPAVNDFTLTIRVSPLKTLLSANLSSEVFNAAWETGKKQDFDPIPANIMAQFADAPPSAASAG